MAKCDGWPEERINQTKSDIIIVIITITIIVIVTIIVIITINISIIFIVRNHNSEKCEVCKKVKVSDDKSYLVIKV